MSDKLEIERKYVIKMPDFDILAEQTEYTVSSIVQIYLRSVQGVTYRVRSRTYPDRTVYTENKKIRVDRMSSEEFEREITEDRFFALSKDIREGSRPIVKTRHTFVYRSLTFEIDVYPEWKNTAIMEVELEERDCKIEIPEFIEIVREVTGHFEYSNSAMSQKIPQELI